MIVSQPICEWVPREDQELRRTCRLSGLGQRGEALCHVGLHVRRSAGAQVRHEGDAEALFRRLQPQRLVEYCSIG